jgi:DNA-binding MarR family transcriptional regulator
MHPIISRSALTGQAASPASVEGRSRGRLDRDANVHHVNDKLDVHWMNALSHAVFVTGTDHLPMAQASKADDARIILGLLEYVGRGGEQSQRRLASELGVALGLANAYLKRCVKKGLVKVRHVPARRYAYYLTPHGFAEKSRLTVEYLSHSLALFRRAKADCTAALERARAHGFVRIALLGASDIAEIAAICALDGGFTIAAVVDAGVKAERFAGAPVVRNLEELAPLPDALLVTDIQNATTTLRDAVVKFGAERVLAPALLGVQPDDMAEGA